MRRSKGSNDELLRVGRALSEAEINKLLDTLEQALIAGNLQEADRYVERLADGDPRMPDILIQRLVDGRTIHPVIILELVEILTGEETANCLKRIATSRDIADIVRFGARQRLGWPARNERKSRREFLATMADATTVLMDATSDGIDSWPLGIDVLEEVLGYLQAVPSAQRREVVQQIFEKLGGSAAVLMQAALHIADRPLQRFILDELVKRRVKSATGAIDRLANTASHRSLRHEALVAFQRLHVRCVNGRLMEEEQRSLPPVDRVLMSQIDGAGGQVVIIVREIDRDLCMVLDIFHSDEWGIKSTFGLSRATKDNVYALIDEMQEEGICLVSTDLAAARGILTAAVAVNGDSKHTIPPAFELWEALLHDVYPPRAEEESYLPELDDAPFVGRNDLVSKSALLVDHEFFLGWEFQPARVLSAMLLTPPPAGSIWTDEQYEPMIREIVDQDVRNALHRRLRRQAWLLDKAGDPESRDIALAVAAQISAGRMSELTKQPFLRTLVRRGALGLLTNPGD